MSTANAAMISQWNGNAGRRWASMQERFDSCLRRFGDVALQSCNAQPGESILDIGCGSGDTTLVLADGVGASGRVVGVDISAPLLEVARKRSAQRNVDSVVEFILADAAFHAFTPQSFDAIFSRFGVMFFDEPVAAFKNLHSALKSTGRIDFVCWRTKNENLWVKNPESIIHSIVTPAVVAPTPRSPGPFAFAEKDHVENVLTLAGFHNILIRPLDIPFEMGSSVEEAITIALTLGPGAHALATASEEQKQQVRAQLEKEFTPLLKEDGIHLPAAIWCVHATAE